MKPQFIFLLGLATSAAQASVVSDLPGAVGKLLGHDPKVLNIYETQQKNLDRAETRYQPWSGSYWPDITGGITNHWRDHELFWAKLRFGLRYDVAKTAVRNDFKAVCEKYPTWDEKKLNDKLSPAEKYDLLMGDTNFSFTRAIMEETDFRADHRLTTKTRDGATRDTDDQEGDDNNNYQVDVQDDQGNSLAYSKYDNQVEYIFWRKKGGTLAYWSGICDGWAPASLYLPRPVKPVTMMSPTGQAITFYPDDLKALGTYLFARSNTPYFTTMNYRFAGRKCGEAGKPSTNDQGFVKDIRCNDLDAGVWHTALLNRIGMDRMGFIMDVDNNLKINNHPVSSYELTYYNPVTGKEGSLKDSVVDRASVKDGYASRRHADTKYLVGVKSKVHMLYYIWAETGTNKRNRDYDNPAQDEFKDISFEYDLELDANGNILGGEWGKRSDDRKTSVKYGDQPDFIWMANVDALPYSEMSVYATSGYQIDPSNPRPFGNTQWAWDGKGPMPEDWTRAARADLTWYPPVVGEKKTDKENKTTDVYPFDAKNSVLKSAQPLSHVVYYLFDQARSSGQK